MKAGLETLYRTCNDPVYIHPDPLERVVIFPSVKDREIAGMIASCLAFGRVSQILVALSRIFSIMGPSPRKYVEEGDERRFKRDFKGFVYRFVREEHMVALLSGLREMVDSFGTLEGCFVSGMSQDDETVLEAMTPFVGHLVKRYDPGYLLARPDRKSSMKRMNLFLRWMVRKDRVDPGGWTGVEPARLIVPLDTHMHRISVRLGLTERKASDMRTALEITGAFRRYSPEDPVKYDFALTRFGIRSELDMDRCCDFLQGTG